MNTEPDDNPEPRYLIAEKFKSLQGEGVWTGTPMAFIRFSGCSVGKKTCNACDTAFEYVMPWRGGGLFTVGDLLDWVDIYNHICLTGGEPLDQDLTPFLRFPGVLHLETSGTKPIPRELLHSDVHICVSPKPGFREDVIAIADEVKVIVPGLYTAGPGTGWPTISDALRWAGSGKGVVFLQPRNGTHEIDKVNLGLVLDIIRDHPELRLSAQLHKILHVQ
jgi:organic radical activating enzyme